MEKQMKSGGWIKTVAFFFVLVSFTGCSWRNEIYIFNFKPHPLVVRLDIRGSREYADRPAVSILRRENNEVVLGDTVTSYRRKEDSLWYFELPPRSALLIGLLHNRNPEKEADCRTFTDSIRYLQMLSPDDASLTCTGKACYSLLRRFRGGMAGFVME